MAYTNLEYVIENGLLLVAKMAETIPAKRGYKHVPSQIEKESNMRLEAFEYNQSLYKKLCKIRPDPNESTGGSPYRYFKSNSDLLTKDEIEKIRENYALLGIQF